MADEVRLAYQGITPIATCHWQWVANILAARGAEHAWETLGLSWGCRWNGGSVLFGLASWPILFRDLRGAEISILTFDSAAEARETELRLSAAGLPFVVEVDEYFIPTDQRERTHIVHAILVVKRDTERIRVVDAVLGPNVLEFSASNYEVMRASSCRGRVEGFKLYSIASTPTIDCKPEVLLKGVRVHLGTTLTDSLLSLERYIEWVRRSDGDIDVCRAAGERFQAARFFDFLSERIDGAAKPAALLDRLSRDWYLIHMLANHGRSIDARSRQRIVRLLNKLLRDEVAVAKAVME